jgi:EAL domain-containing protein (putative c-di-GMP-specific phosphodiesterase class I)
MTDAAASAAPTGGDAIADRVRNALAARAFRIVYQPIVDLAEGVVAAVEALSRFTAEPYGPPDVWFADAWQVGMGAELELAAFEAALADLHHVPAGCRVAVNLSPPVIAHPDLLGYVAAAGPARVVIELTEHVAVHDYDRVRSAVAILRGRGAKLAVDDMGAGFASFRHIVKLAPDIIKLDRELVSGIDADPVRRSVATAMVNFASDVGSDIVAEGIETRGELDAVRALGIRYGQGMLLGAPGPAESLSELLPDPLPDSMPESLSAALRPGPVPAAHDHLAATAEALARLADAAGRGDLRAEPAELATLDQAVAVIARIAARHGAVEPVAAPGAPWA